MKVDINKTYRTKGGHPVVIYATHEGQKYAVHGAYQNEDGEWVNDCWSQEGGFFPINGPTDLDLVEVLPERVVWINEYEDGHFENVHTTKEQADKHHRGFRIALHRVVLNEDTVWREGDDE